LIQNDTLRVAAFEHVTEIWARDDRTAAVDYIDHCPALSPAQKKTLAAKLVAGKASRPPTVNR
jgi:hypothetical protein